MLSSKWLPTVSPFIKNIKKEVVVSHGDVYSAVHAKNEANNQFPTAFKFIIIIK